MPTGVWGLGLHEGVVKGAGKSTAPSANKPRRPASLIHFVFRVGMFPPFTKSPRVLDRDYNQGCKNPQ